MFQKESEWKVKVRDWWYSVQDAQKCPDEIKRVEIEHIIRETLAHREKEIAEEVEKALEKHFEGFECGHNGLKENILAIINNKSL